MAECSTIFGRFYVFNCLILNYLFASIFEKYKHDNINLQIQEFMLLNVANLPTMVEFRIVWFKYNNYNK